MKMNNALKELEQIAQRLDVYMHEYGNSAALVTAAEAIADELDQRNVTITRVQITLQVDVQHKTKLDEGEMFDLVCDNFRGGDCLITDIFTIEENMDVTYDITVDAS